MLKSATEDGDYSRCILSPGSPEQDEFEYLANRFKILSEPARLRLLASLARGEQNVQDLCEQTGLHQANVSKHLQLLRATGIIACRREGIFRYYRLIDQSFISACHELCQHCLTTSVAIDKSFDPLAEDLNNPVDQTNNDTQDHPHVTKDLPSNTWRCGCDRSCTQ